MINSKAIGLFYLAYTVYTIYIVLVSDYNPVYAIGGLLSIWLCYLAYKRGEKTDKKKTGIRNDSTEYVTIRKSKYPLSNIGHWHVIKYLFALVLSIVCSTVAAEFYTGKGISAVLGSLASSGMSSYYSYQQYFANNSIDSFSITKIPYILMLSYCTLIMIWGYLGILLENKRIRIVQIFFLIGVTLSYLYFGVARGTNFEAFIVFITLAYCLLRKMQVVPKKKRKKYYLIIAILSLLLILIFRIVVSNRGIVFGYKITEEINYTDTSIISIMFPTLTNIAISLFGYIGFGIFTTGVTIIDIIFKSAKSIFAASIPFGYNMIYDQSLRSLVDIRVGIGVRWFPDLINMIYVFGVPVFFLLIFLLGRLVIRVNQKQYPELLKNVVSIIVFIEMLSLPLGNFIATSSSNKIMILFTIIWIISLRGRHADGKHEVVGG